MKARSVLVAAAVLGALLAGAPAVSAAPAPPTRADVSRQDREYLNRIHQTDLFEIIAGRLADRGGCARVRELGHEFAEHHTALDADLIGVAARNAVPLYSVPEPEQLGQIADLAARSGGDFDVTWLRDQIAAHVRALAAGEAETSYGWSAEVRALAARSEPVLRHHLEQATAALETCTPGFRRGERTVSPG
jgi:putative membrane protein